MKVKTIVPDINHEYTASKPSPTINTATRILIVEHDEHDIDLIQHELKKGKINYVAQVVETGPEYEKALRIFKPDIILSDYSLPGFGGPAAFKIRQELAPQTPFIFVTGSLGEEKAVELIKSGVTDYNLKDKLFTLCNKVDRALKEAKAEKEKIRTAEKIAEANEIHLAKAREVADYQYALEESTLLSVTDVKGNIIHVNDKFCEVSKYTREEMLGQNHRIVRSDYHPKAFMQNLWATISSGKIWRNEVCNRAKDGTLYWIDKTIVPFLDKTGKPSRYVAINKDITSRKEAEEKLKKAYKELIEEQQRLKLLESVITNTKDSVVITEAESQDELGPKILYVNKAFTKMTGYNAEDVIGRSPGFLQGPKTDKKELKRWSNALEKWESCEITVVNYRKNGEEFWINSSITPVANEKGWFTHWISIERDVTEYKIAEAAIQDLNENLEKKINERTIELTETNTALEAFSYSASHDLRAPLRSIMGFAKIIDKEYSSSFSVDAKEMFGYVYSNAQRMDKIITDLLTLAKCSKEKLHPVSIDLNELVKNVWDKISFATPHKAKLIVLMLPEIAGDVSMIEQVLINLLGNAVKYSSKKKEPQVVMGYEATADTLTFHIKDNGAGFDMNNYDKLFGAFQRLHGSSDFEGNGIGLSIVKRIIEKHNGKVWAESKVDEGATFYFTLPLKSQLP